jgi:hypothetical protein
MIQITVLTTFACAAAGFAAIQDHVLVQNLHVIEPGATLRGGEQKPWPLTRVIHRHGVRTVLCLTEPEPREREVAESHGARWYCVRLAESGSQALFDDLEAAAAVVASPANRPVFFHCKRGVYRSNLVHAVYRMKFCGWELEQAFDELRAVGFDPLTSGGDNSCRELLVRYYRQRVAPPASREPSGIRSESS